MGAAFRASQARPNPVTQLSNQAVPATAAGVGQMTQQAVQQHGMDSQQPQMGAAMPQARPIPGQAPVPMQGLAAGNMPKVAEFQKCFWNSIGDRHSSGSRFSPDFLANSAALRGAAAGGASPWSKGAMLPGANPAAPPPGSQLAPDLLPFGSGVGAPAVPMQMTPPGGAGAPGWRISAPASSSRSERRRRASSRSRTTRCAARGSISRRGP